MNAVGRKIELWLVQYELDAYKDQTGQSQEGYVVHDQRVVTVVDTFPQQDGYTDKVYSDAGWVAEDEWGMVFKGIQNLVDYGGGRRWVCEAVPPKGQYWKAAPKYGVGHITVEGFPVERILDE